MAMPREVQPELVFMGELQSKSYVSHVKQSQAIQLSSRCSEMMSQNFKYLDVTEQKVLCLLEAWGAVQWVSAGNMKHGGDCFSKMSGPTYLLSSFKNFEQVHLQESMLFKAQGGIDLIYFSCFRSLLLL